MILIPAIDLISGQAVRLTRGEFNQKSIFPFTPVEYAQKWVNQGAELIHIVDLEATLEGRPINHKTIENIRSKVSVRLQIGGGVRTKEIFKKWIDCGVDRVVVGTKALDEPFIKGILKDFPDQTVVSLDVREGKVQTEGWITSTPISHSELAKKLAGLGVQHFVYTDISRDGVLEGPNWEGLESLLNEVSAKIILSGGVSHRDHVKRLATLSQKYDNLYGAIIGKALYTEKVKLGELVQLLKETQTHA